MVSLSNSDQSVETLPHPSAKEPPTTHLIPVAHHGYCTFHSPGNILQNCFTA